MSNLTDLISSGGGGGPIGECRVFTSASGDIFTGSDESVWLRTGSTTADRASYPDALGAELWLRASTYDGDNGTWNFNPENGQSLIKAGSLNGRVIGGFNADHIYPNRYNSADMRHGTIGTQANQYQVVPSSDTSQTFRGFNYVQCSSGSPDSAFTGADGLFSIAVWTDGSIDTYLGSYVNNANGANDPDAATQMMFYRHDYMMLKTSTGTDLPPKNQHHGNVHFDNVNRKLYVMAGAQTGMNLYVYDFTSESTFGVTNGTLSVSSKNATAAAIVYTDDADVYNVYSTTWSPTHMYVSYLHSNGTKNIREIPLSGDLSWGSGSDYAQVGSQDVYSQSGTDINHTGSSYDSPYFAFYEMDGTTPTFVKNEGSNKLVQARVENVVGANALTTVSPGTSLAYYQRIL